MSDIPYNMNHEADEYLHDVAEDATEMAKGIAALLDKATAEKEQVKRALILAKAGIFSRIIGELDNSENLLTGF